MLLGLPALVLRARAGVRLQLYPKRRRRKASGNYPTLPKQIAYHEAGHCVAARLLGVGVQECFIGNRQHPTKKILRRGGTVYIRSENWAATQAAMTEETAFQYMTNQIQVSAAGCLATDLLANPNPTGCKVKGDDATQMLDAVKQWNAHMPHRQVNPDELLSNLTQETSKLLQENWDKVEYIANALLTKGTLGGSDIDQILKEENAP